MSQVELSFAEEIEEKHTCVYNLMYFFLSFLVPQFVCPHVFLSDFDISLKIMSLYVYMYILFFCSSAIVDPALDYLL